MKSSQLYPSPEPSYDQANNQIDELELAYEASLDGGKSKKAIMHQREADVMATMASLAGYVQMISGGDMERILASGFDVKKGPGAPKATEKVMGLSATPGKSDGECLLSWTKDPAAKIYIVQTSADGVNGWEECASPTRTKVLLTGLVSGGRPFFRVAAKGTGGTMIWSDVIQGKVA